MPIKERIVDLAAIASLVSGCGNGPQEMETTAADGSTPPWEQTGGASTTTATSEGEDGAGTNDGEGGEGTPDGTTGAPSMTTSGGGTTSSGGTTSADDDTAGDLPPIPDLGGMDTGYDDGDDDDDDAAGP